MLDSPLQICYACSLRLEPSPCQHLVCNLQLHLERSQHRLLVLASEVVQHLVVEVLLVQSLLLVHRHPQLLVQLQPPPLVRLQEGLELQRQHLVRQVAVLQLISSQCKHICQLHASDKPCAGSLILLTDLQMQPWCRQIYNLARFFVSDV